MNNANEIKKDLDNYQQLNRKQLFILLLSILIVALCAITYQLIIGTVSSYLIGNSVYQFSMTIGLFMFAMGVGSFLSKGIIRNLISNFVFIEVVLAVIGGLSSLLLFMAFPLITALYTIVMYALILIIGTLVGLELPLLTRILTHKESIRHSIADVMSLDYVGALIGAVIFPLFLLPQLGLVRSSFAIGLINMGVAIINIHFFRVHLQRPRLMATVSVSLLGVLIILTIMGTRLTSFAENNLYFDQVIFKQQTPYQRIVYTKSYVDGEKRLYLDGHVQFCDRDEYRYHEALVHPVMSVPGPRDTILILGGGDGLAAREVLKYADVKRIHLVDIDPAITGFCSRFPGIAKLNQGSLTHPKLEIFNQDAFTFMNQKGILYDKVIIDLPDPHNEALNKLYSREFYKIIKMRMKPHGMLVSQSASPFYTRNTYWSIARTIEEATFAVFSYQVTIPTFGIWGFHIGASTQLSPGDFDIQVATRYLNNQTMQTASVFGRDIDRIDAPVNSLMDPKLYMLYVRELRGDPI